MEYHSRTSIRNLRKRQQARANKAATSSSASAPRQAQSRGAVGLDHHYHHQRDQNEQQIGSHGTTTLLTGYEVLDQRRLEVIKMISDKLETGLNDETLSAIMDLLRAGYHTDAIISVIRSLS